MAEEEVMSNLPPQGVVGYTIKELLAQQQQVLNVNQQQAMQKLDRIEARIEIIAGNKADKSQVEDHERRILHFELQEGRSQELVTDFKEYKTRVDHLETDSATKTAVEAYKRRSLWAAGLGSGGLLTGVVNVFLMIARHKP